MRLGIQKVCCQGLPHLLGFNEPKCHLQGHVLVRVTQQIQLNVWVGNASCEDITKYSICIVDILLARWALDNKLANAHLAMEADIKDTHSLITVEMDPDDHAVFLSDCKTFDGLKDLDGFDGLKEHCLYVALC